MNKITLLREGFGEQDEWLEATPRAALLVYSNYTDDLDATDWIPVGAHHHKTFRDTVHREAYVFQELKEKLCPTN